MSDLASITVYIDDVRAAGFCARGIKTWFDGQNLNFREFIKRGVSSDVLLKTQDPQAVLAVEAARRRLNG